MTALGAWLLTPMSGSGVHHIEPWAYWHARCMVLAWGVLLPLGALAARYFKVLPRQRWPEQLDNTAWWHAHRTLQWAGVGAMTLGVAMAWGHGGGGQAAARLHAWAGWAVVVVGWLQVAAGVARGTKGGPTANPLHDAASAQWQPSAAAQPQQVPAAQWRGDHYDMTPRRTWFERLHKSLGWASVLAALVVTAIGLMLVDAPRWMPVVLAAWWLLLAAAAWHWQRQGRCIDTYQAIWGPDPRHPGNGVKPIGWGVRRPGHIPGLTNKQHG